MSRLLTTRVRDAILLVAAKSFDLGPKDILGDSRKRPVAYARHYAMWLLRELGYSLPEIGRQLRRDHSSVLFGVRAHAARVESGDLSTTLLIKSVDSEEQSGNRDFNEEPNRARLVA